MAEHYYLNRVPQSEYRQGKLKNRDEYYHIDLALSAVKKSLNKTQKKELLDKINSVYEQIVSTVLSEEVCSRLDKAVFLAPILEELHLDGNG